MDLSDPATASNLAAQIAVQIDVASVAASPAKHSWRVSPSSLGGECVAREWYKWRWAKLRSIEGRIARLFKRGHSEEGKLSTLLRASGWRVIETDPAKEGRAINQFGIKLFDGHLTGYLDGIGSHPELTGGLDILLEYKTYNAKRFAALCNKKVKLSDWEYYVQVCIYMRERDLPWCLFIATCKNDDELHIECIPRDDATAERAMQTAHTVIYSKARPARIAQSPAFYVCKTCPYVEICHNHAPVEISCRSCQHSEPIAGGNFRCGLWQTNIPDEKAIREACNSHLAIF